MKRFEFHSNRYSSLVGFSVGLCLMYLEMFNCHECASEIVYPMI